MQQITTGGADLDHRLLPVNGITMHPWLALQILLAHLHGHYRGIGIARAATPL